MKETLRPIWHELACRISSGARHAVISGADVEGKPIPYDFLIASIHGLLWHRIGGEVLRLSEFPAYGISKRLNRWYVFEKIRTRLGFTGRLKSFELVDGFICNPKVELTQLDPDVHQIDWAGDELFLTDTGNNRLAVYAYNGRKLELKRQLWPFGQLENGRDSENYVHLNSVYVENGKIHLILHNQTLKTGKYSEWATLSENFDVLSRRPLDSHSGHNVLACELGVLSCDSFRGRLLLDNNEILKFPCYLRGLAKHGDDVLVGGSEVAVGKKRGGPNAAGSVMWASLTRPMVRSILTLRGFGNLYEVRITNHQDESLSAQY